MAVVDMPIIPTIAALVREVPGTISLGQGVVHYPPPASALQAVGALADDPLLHRYQSVFGCAPLLEALIDKLATENGIVAHPGGSRGAPGDSHVMVTAGSNSALLAAIMAVGDPGDEFILPTPYFFNHEMAVRMCNGTPVPVPTRSDWQLDLAAIEAAITPRTRAIITVSPNNPTGAVYAPEDLAAVNALCGARGLYHFSDEAYEYFVYGGARHFSPGSLPGAAAHTLSFYTFSKAFGMASWRVGYVVYPAALGDALSKVQDTNLICAPVASQYAALAAMRQGRDWLAPRLASLAAVREQVLDGLRALDGLARVPRTEGGFYLMVELPGLGDADPIAFNEAMVRQHQVATIPGFAFGLSDVRSANYQRLSYGALDAASVRQGVERFVHAVRHWYRRA
ncbi:MAG: aminotransferase class I/II-fold pyridoxal phosphate-dependent enzyme [Burkholderiaceae bacterium]